MKKLATVVPATEGKGYEVMLGDWCVGTAKVLSDASLHANIINKAVDGAIADAEIKARQDGYDEGYDIGYDEGYEDGKGETE
jgi:hypothetical protein